MSRGVNKVFLMGNLGEDPQLKESQTGKIMILKVVTTHSFKTKEGKDSVHYENHKVIAFSKLADAVQKYLRKNSRVYIEGSIKYNSWTDKDGNARKTTEIIAKDIQMVDLQQNRDDRGNRNDYPDQNQSSLSEYDDIPF